MADGIGTTTWIYDTFGGLIWRIFSSPTSAGVLSTSAAVDHADHDQERACALTKSKLW
jgi:hypothetical protein